MKACTALIAALLLMSGCATHLVSADERTVIVESQAMEAGEAQRIAAAECAKHKRFARMSGKADYWDRNYTFDCVQ